MIALKQHVNLACVSMGVCTLRHCHIFTIILYRRSSCRCTPGWHWPLHDMFSFLHLACSPVALSLYFVVRLLMPFLQFCFVVDASRLFAFRWVTMLRVVCCVWVLRFMCCIEYAVYWCVSLCCIPHPNIALARVAWTRFLILSRTHIKSYRKGLENTVNRPCG